MRRARDARDWRLPDGDAVPVGHRRRARGRAGVRLRSGYGATVDEAIVTGACHWTCALRAALAGEESFETTLDGRRFHVGIDGYDRTMSTGPIDDDDTADARARLGAGDGWLTEHVLASGMLPLLTGPTLLSVFVAAAPERMVEVKVNGRDWPPSLGVFDGCEPEPEGVVSLLREIAVITPLEPFAGFGTDSLQRTLNGIATDPEPERAAGWQGWAAHGGALGPVWTGDATALPEDYRYFLTRVAGPGAGPGYGLLPPQVVDGVIPLAHAGCGVTWVLRDGEVWVDAAGSDQTYARVASSFTDWYLAWLDHAVRGAGPWLHWDNAACATTSVLNQMIEGLEQEGESVDVLPERLDRHGIALAGGGNYQDSGPLDPCHGCVALAARLGLRPDVFAPGASLDRGPFGAQVGTEEPEPHTGDQPSTHQLTRPVRRRRWLWR